jgi:L-ribulose-5-phosphate 3-epimerase
MNADAQVQAPSPEASGGTNQHLGDSKPGRLTRRRFVDTTLRAATGLALSSPAAERVLGAQGLHPRLAVFSKVYQEMKLDFEQAAEATAEAGLDGIDCPVRPGGEIVPERAVDELPRYAETLRKRGVGLLLLTTGIQGVASPHARDILATGRRLGVQYYRLGYWTHRPDRPAASLQAEVRASLKELSALNGEIGVCGVLQNHSAPEDHARRNAGCDLGEMYELVKDLDPERIGVAFDLGHAIVEHGDLWREHFERLKPHIRVVYIKDVRRPARFVAFGEGEFGQSGFFKLLAGMNYRAPLSVHIEYDWAPAADRTRQRLVKTLRESKRVLEQWLAAAN